MWLLISTTKLLKFFDLKSDVAIEVNGLNYFIKEKGHVPEIKFDHNFAVSKLLENGFPMFVNKEDARKAAVLGKLTGFKYLKLSPSIIKIENDNRSTFNFINRSNDVDNSEVVIFNKNTTEN